MQKVLMTSDGKKVVTSSNDICLYSAPVNPPNTGTTFTRGTNLFAHKSRSGNIYFYKYFWSMWQGENSSYELIDKDEAKEFLLVKAGLSGYGSLNAKEIEKAREFGFNLLDETA